MAGLTPREHTASVLKRMNLAGSVPGNLDRSNDAEGDNYGLTAARSSDSSNFKLSGAPKAPHMGRPGRQAGGRISGDLVRTRRTPQETAKDIADEDGVADELAKDRATGGRVGFAKGGRAKGKTVVNVIIGGQKAASPMPPPPMAAPGPVGPPRPPPGPPPGLPPGGPPPGMPPGGAPMGPAGAPPPGVPPMLRARGGRIEIGTPGVHDYGKAGVKHGSTNEKYGGGSGLGRQERARHQK